MSCENVWDTFARLVEGFCETNVETKDPTSGPFLSRNSTYDECFRAKRNAVSWVSVRALVGFHEFKC